MEARLDFRFLAFLSAASLACSSEWETLRTFRSTLAKASYSAGVPGFRFVGIGYQYNHSQVVTPMKMLPLAGPSHGSPDALLDSAKLWAARISWTLASARCWLMTSTQILWFELCSVGPRTAIARAAIRGLSQDVHDPTDLGPIFEPDSAIGVLVPCRRTDVRSQDAELLQTMHPWATAADQWMFFLGWERGEAYAHDNPHPRKREKAAVTSTPSPLQHNTDQYSPVIPNPQPRRESSFLIR